MIAERNQNNGKAFHDVYTYIKQVWEDKEMKAKKAKDELVR